jgi:hypothetical protein
MSSFASDRIEATRLKPYSNVLYFEQARDDINILRGSVSSEGVRS